MGALLTVPQAAARRGVSKWTAYRRIKETGSFYGAPVIDRGGFLRINEDDIDGTEAGAA